MLLDAIEYQFVASVLVVKSAFISAIAGLM